MLDPTTFGNQTCALRLVELLNEREDPKLTRHVTNFLTTRNRMIAALTCIPGRKERLTFANMLKDEINDAAITDAPAIVESFAKNVAISRLKERVIDPTMAADGDLELPELHANDGEFDFNNTENVVSEGKASYAVKFISYEHATEFLALHGIRSGVVFNDGFWFFRSSLSMADISPYAVVVHKISDDYCESIIESFNRTHWIGPRSSAGL